jgi:ComEC/Rec2-related protein
VIWDQDLILTENNQYRGWAWVIPLRDELELSALKKRCWVEFKSPQSVPKNQFGIFLKGTQVSAWSLPEKLSKDFPKLKIALEENTFDVPWWVHTRALFLTPLESWKQQDQHRGLAYSLITGNRQHIQNSTKHNFDRLGLMALLALSGLHVGIAFNLFRKIPYLKHYKLASSVGGVSLVILYVFLAGWPLSMVRAGAMICLFVMSLFLGRRHVGLNGLVLLALWEWTRNPEVIYRLDFLLSYLGVFGIMWMLKLNSAIFKTKKWFHAPLKIYLVSWGAMLWTWPIVLSFFGKLPHLGWWFAPPIFAIFGILVLYVLFLGIVNFIGVGLYDSFWIPLEWGSNLFQSLSLGGSWTIPWEAPPLAWTVLYYILLIAIGIISSFCNQTPHESSEVAF